MGEDLSIWSPGNVIEFQTFAKWIEKNIPGHWRCCWIKYDFFFLSWAGQKYTTFKQLTLVTCMRLANALQMVWENRHLVHWYKKYMLYKIKPHPNLPGKELARTKNSFHTCNILRIEKECWIFPIFHQVSVADSVYIIHWIEQNVVYDDSSIWSKQMWNIHILSLTLCNYRYSGNPFLKGKTSISSLGTLQTRIDRKNMPYLHYFW